MAKVDSRIIDNAIDTAISKTPILANQVNPQDVRFQLFLRISNDLKAIKGQTVNSATVNRIAQTHAYDLSRLYNQYSPMAAQTFSESTSDGGHESFGDYVLENSPDDFSERVIFSNKAQSDRTNDRRATLSRMGLNLEKLELFKLQQQRGVLEGEDEVTEEDLLLPQDTNEEYFVTPEIEDDLPPEQWGRTLHVSKPKDVSPAFEQGVQVSPSPPKRIGRKVKQAVVEASHSVTRDNKAVVTHTANEAYTEDTSKPKVIRVNKKKKLEDTNHSIPPETKEHGGLHGNQTNGLSLGEVEKPLIPAEQENGAARSEAPDNIKKVAKVENQSNVPASADKKRAHKKRLIKEIELNVSKEVKELQKKSLQEIKNNEEFQAAVRQNTGYTSRVMLAAALHDKKLDFYDKAVDGQITQQAEEKDFSFMIRRLRMRFNYSQKELADKLGVPLSTIKTWEYGTRDASGAGQVLIKLLDEFPAIMALL